MASASRVDQATIAFRRVLAEANAGEQARVDALVVLAQRTVYAATWPGQQTARTLTNSHGESALPLFTGLDVLDVTATRFGWRNPDGTLQFRELGAREALRHALTRNVHFVVVDLGSEHSVEFAREELEPLVNLQEQRSGTGPFAGSVERQAALLDAVRRTSSRPPRTPLPASPPMLQPRTVAESQPIPTVRPPMAAKARTPMPPPAAGAPPRRITPAPRPPTPAHPVKPVSGPRPVQREDLPLSPPANVQRGPPPPPAPPPPAVAPASRLDEPTLAERTGTHPGVEAPDLPDTVLHGISTGLRSFPEVEWACVMADGSEIPLIAVRVDPSFLNRVADITDAIMDVGDKQALSLQVLLLNNQDLVKNARKNGKAFYPWRR